MATLYCAVGPDFLMKVIDSGSHRWKPHHFQLMKKKEMVYVHIMQLGSVLGLLGLRGRTSFNLPRR